MGSSSRLEGCPNSRRTEVVLTRAASHRRPRLAERREPRRNRSRPSLGRRWSAIARSPSPWTRAPTGAPRQHPAPSRTAHYRGGVGSSSASGKEPRLLQMRQRARILRQRIASCYASSKGPAAAAPAAQCCPDTEEDGLSNGASHEVSIPLFTGWNAAIPRRLRPCDGARQRSLPWWSST